MIMTTRVTTITLSIGTTIIMSMITIIVTRVITIIIIIIITSITTIIITTIITTQITTMMITITKTIITTVITKTITITRQPEHGTLSNISFSASESDIDLAKWTATYTPDTNYAGDDEIRFKVTNPNNLNSNGISDESIISIVVSGVNDAPTITAISP